MQSGRAARGAARYARAAALLVAIATIGSTVSAAPLRDPTEVHKATLKNGLHVVIVRNTIAPVVSTDLTYLVGSRDDPADLPGMAHAQEHMMFRGTKNLSTAQLGTIATALGGAFNAQTSDTRTQYQFTVPAADLDAILRIESDRMRDVLDLQSQWEDERGAIEQEVARDEAQPGGDFFNDAQAIAFKGTVYEHPGVGTKAAFDRLTGPRLKAFWDRWYAPNNAVLVIAGDVDPDATLQAVRSYFDGIPAKAIPAHPRAEFAPLKRTVIRRGTTLAYPLAAVGFRMPGLDSPDFLPSYVLQGILGANQAPLHALADDGKALDGDWVAMPYFPEAQLTFAIAALAPGSDPDAMAKQLEAIMTNYQRHGVPSDLFETTKRRLIADQELGRNSIEQLASDWADTVALDGQPSIAHEQDLIAAVTLADVNRVARKYLDTDHAIVGALTPSFNASQNAPPQPTGVGKENPLGTQPFTALPAWARPLVGPVVLPSSGLTPTLTKLANGVTLVVQPETISDSVFVYGDVRTTPALQEPLGKEGISSILEGMFAYGTASLDRTAFQRAQDDIDSTISGGSSFGVQTTSASFDRAVALLAQNELTPRLDDETLDVAKRRAIDDLQTSLNSSHSVAVRRAAEKLLPAGDPELRQPTVAGLQAMSLNDLTAYDLKVMRPDVTTIVVVGNVTAARAQAAIEKNFGGWHAAGPPPALDLPGVPRNPPAEVKVDLPGIRESFVTLEQMLPITRTSPDFYPLLLGNAILGGGSLGPEQSRLFRDIRQNAGLVYSIDSHIDAATVARSRFSIEFACAPANDARIEGLIAQELARMRSEPVAAPELALMKASMVRRVVIGGGSVASIGGTLLDAAANAQPLDQSQIDARKLNATDAAAIQAAFNAEIQPNNFVRMLEGP